MPDRNNKTVMNAADYGATPSLCTCSEALKSQLFFPSLINRFHQKTKTIFDYKRSKEIYCQSSCKLVVCYKLTLVLYINSYNNQADVLFSSKESLKLSDICYYFSLHNTFF